MIIGKCPICGEEMRIGSDMTNADRIRSMTDEKLADLLSGENIYPWCLKEPCSEECRECILTWLKEEVKDEHT